MLHSFQPMARHGEHSVSTNTAVILQVLLPVRMLLVPQRLALWPAKQLLAFSKHVAHDRHERARTLVASKKAP